MTQLYGLPSVSSILLEGKSKQCNLLVCHCVEQAIHNSTRKSPSLILIHGNYLVPIVCNFRQVQCLRKVNKIENILLETASTKTYHLKKKYSHLWLVIYKHLKCSVITSRMVITLVNSHKVWSITIYKITMGCSQYLSYLTIIPQACTGYEMVTR